MKATHSTPWVVLEKTDDYRIEYTMTEHGLMCRYLWRDDQGIRTDDWCPSIHKTMPKHVKPITEAA